MLHIVNLTKRHGERVALKSSSIALPRAHFVAMLGPNGTGKSTLFQVLTGLFAADEGQVEIAGHSLRSAPAQALRNVGVVFQQIALDLNLSVRHNRLFQADLQGLPRTPAREGIDAGCMRLGIGGDLERKARELSGGNRRKVELVRACPHQPPLEEIEVQMT